MSNLRKSIVEILCYCASLVGNRICIDLSIKDKQELEEIFKREVKNSDVVEFAGNFYRIILSDKNGGSFIYFDKESYIALGEEINEKMTNLREFSAGLKNDNCS